MSSKDELRQLMKKGIAERKSKVDSPFAKYTSAGQLQCSLCGTTIKTESLWPVHIKSKTHKDNQAQLEKPKKATSSNPTVSAPEAPPPSSSSSKAPSDTKRDRTEEDKDLMPPPPAKKVKDSPPSAPTGLPTGFFDAYGDDEEDKEEEAEAEENGKEEVNGAEKVAASPAPAPSPVPPKSSIPAGFFDDPTMDAQMRGTKTPAKIKEEAIDKAYEKYQEVLGEELKNSEKIQVEELLKDESIDLEGDNEIVDREQERREREDKMLELKKKAERVKELKAKLTAAKPKVVDVGDDDLVSLRLDEGEKIKRGGEGRRAAESHETEVYFYSTRYHQIHFMIGEQSLQRCTHDDCILIITCGGQLPVLL